MTQYTEVDDMEVKRMKKGKKKEKEKTPKVKSRVQYLKWDEIPQQPGSNLYKFFVGMYKKGGMKVKEFEKLVKKTGAQPNFILRCLRKGFNYEWTWDWDDSNGRYRIFNLKDHRKKKKAA